VRVVAIIQARMGSSRLPGKVLKDLQGKSVLARVVERVSRTGIINESLVATTDQRADDAIVEECRRCSVPVSRGDESDVLDRYFRAAQLSKADVIVRITADCPLIDPEIADKTIRAFLDQHPDYASNCLRRTYPRGLDTEVMTMQSLERAWRQAGQKHERAHVTPYIYEHPQEFKLLSVEGDKNYSDQRWTLDTPEDWEFIRAVYDRLQGQGNFLWHDVLQVLEREPKLLELNRSIAQKAVHEG
jgi:spore coat polysaccharide biosynthesis protein SpsF